MNHQSSFPTRQVHLISTAGVPVANGEGKGDLTFFFKAPIVYVPSSYDVILSCVSASIPYVWFNINSTNNVFTISNHFYWTEVAYGLYTYTFAPGNYSINDILSILNKEFAKMHTFSYNQNTHLITLEILDQIKNPIYPGETPPEWIGQTRVKFPTVANSMARFLGFQENVETSVLPIPDLPTNIISRTITSVKPINLINTTSVYVECPDLINESFDSRVGGQSGVICRIPVSGSPGNLLTWTNVFGTHSKLALKQINHVRIRLLDDARNVIDLRGFTWTVTLQFNVAEATPFVEGDWLATRP